MSKGMMLRGEKGLDCEIRADGARLEQMSELKYLGYVFE